MSVQILTDITFFRKNIIVIVIVINTNDFSKTNLLEEHHTSETSSYFIIDDKFIAFGNAYPSKIVAKIDSFPLIQRLIRLVFVLYSDFTFDLYLDFF